MKKFPVFHLRFLITQRGNFFKIIDQWGSFSKRGKKIEEKGKKKKRGKNGKLKQIKGEGEEKEGKGEEKEGKGGKKWEKISKEGKKWAKREEKLKNGYLNSHFLPHSDHFHVVYAVLSGDRERLTR